MHMQETTGANAVEALAVVFLREGLLCVTVSVPQRVWTKSRVTVRAE